MHSSRCAARHRRRAEADGHRPHHREERQGRGDRPDAPGEVVLPQARGRADHRSRDPPLVRRRSLHRDAGVRESKSRRRASKCTSTRSSTGCGSASASSRSAPASRCCRRASMSFATGEAARGSGDGVDAVAVACCCRPAPRSRSTSRPDRIRGCSWSRQRSRDVAHKLACWCGGCSQLPVGAVLVRPLRARAVEDRRRC